MFYWYPYIYIVPFSLPEQVHDHLWICNFRVLHRLHHVHEAGGPEGEEVRGP
jgi:hypothetical protein